MTEAIRLTAKRLRTTVYVWETCENCGKEYQASHDAEMVDRGIPFAKWCQLCHWEEWNVKRDNCPEGIIEVNRAGEMIAAGSCTLPLRHAGRCQPVDREAIFGKAGGS